MSRRAHRGARTLANFAGILGADGLSNGDAEPIADCRPRLVILRRLEATEDCALAGAFIARRVEKTCPSPPPPTQLPHPLQQNTYNEMSKY